MAAIDDLNSQPFYHGPKAELKPGVGDEPLTTPIAATEDERAGRWRSSEKTEWGIHLMV